VRPSIGEALAFDAYSQSSGAAFVINTQLGTVRIAEIEFRQIALQVLLADMVIGASDAALENCEITSTVFVCTITKIPSCSANSGDLHILGERIVELLITGASSSSGSIRRRKWRNGIAGREVRRQADGAPRFGGAAPGRVCLAEVVHGVATQQQVRRRIVVSRQVTARLEFEGEER
jgi:hypothetical protein